MTFVYSAKRFVFMVTCNNEFTGNPLLNDLQLVMLIPENDLDS